MTREEAIQYLESIKICGLENGVMTEPKDANERFHVAVKTLKREWTPDRKVGKWIDHSDDGYVECPFCRSATNCYDDINELHYCFSCGAKMEVGG